MEQERGAHAERGAHVQVYPGPPYLKLPLPNQDVLQPLLNLLLAYAGRGR